MSETLSQLIRSTKEYSDVCDTCKDEILIYPTISGRTEYSQDEVEQITLKKIIDKLQAKEQECEELKDEILSLRKDGKKACDYCVDYITKEKQAYKYKQALDEIEQTISNFPSKGIQDIPQTQIECTQYFLSVSETKLQKILDIIHKAKDGE